jgi:hypothetical protein
MYVRMNDVARCNKDVSLQRAILICIRVQQSLVVWPCSYPNSKWIESWSTGVYGAAVICWPPVEMARFSQHVNNSESVPSAN